MENMAAAMTRAGCAHASIRTIWGIAKSAELRLDEENLYALIARETGKQHMKELTQSELDTVARVLQNMKDGTLKGKAAAQKRTDEGGNPRTVGLRHKIYALTGVLGWNDDNRRINAFVLRVTGVERLEWLSAAQCNKVIEGLKEMVSRLNEVDKLTCKVCERRW